MKMILPFATAALPCLSAHPPQTAPRILEEKPGLVTTADDDGGLVESWRATDGDRSLEYHGGAVIHAPLAYLVFLGDWSKLGAAKAALRLRIERLAAAELEEAGVRRPIALAGSREIVAGSYANDLQIQSALAAIQLRDENVVYVVFVAPTTRITVGGHNDFESYHSNVHTDDIDVR